LQKWRVICKLANTEQTKIMEQKNKFQNVSVKKLPKSEVEIEAEIIAEGLDNARATAIKQIMETVEVPGFRVGHAPENIVIQNVGEMKIMERAAAIVLNAEYGNIVAEHGIKAIGMPKITITKLAPGNPMGFKAITAVLPEITLENYKEIAKTVAKETASKNDGDENAASSVSDEEVDQAIKDLKNKAKEDKILSNFDEIPDFKTKIREELLEHKKMQIKEKKRVAIAEKLIEKAAIDLPEILVESELDTMINQLKGDIEKAGLTFEGYLNQIQKKEEEVRNDWRKSATNKAALQLILSHIGRKENIKPDEEKVKKEMEHILAHYKDADRFRVRMYVENLLVNEAVFQFLENEK